MKSGKAERHALREVAPGTPRSTWRRWKRRYDEHGIDGLFDWRRPARSPVPDAVKEAIYTLRRADPSKQVEDIVAHVKEHHGCGISKTTVRRILHKAGLARRRGAPARSKQCGEQRLELGGMKLVEAAAEATGYVDALVDGVVEQLDEAVRQAAALHGPAPKADTSDRDALGRFTETYSDRYKKEETDEIGPGFASVEEKRPQKDARLFHASGARRDTIKRKTEALFYSPLVGSGRWDGIRVPRGYLLGELCGYEYMPSTLDQFTRELKYVGVSDHLWEIHARKWLEQTASWGDATQMAVLYIDETTKPVWTELYAESTRVSNVGRVMPGIEVVSFNTGYGVPLWMVTASGRNPLVKAVPKLLGELQNKLGGSEVGRIVVIDAEANSIPFLRGLEDGEPQRGWVTRLKSSWVAGKRIFNRNNYRSYRSGDRVRMGVCDFQDRDKNPFRMRVVEVERRTTGEVTYLGASMLLGQDTWSATQIADLYFERWPAQESVFRSINQAVGFKDVHGYGKNLVDNVTVVTKLDELEAKIQRQEERLDKAQDAQQQASERLRQATQQQRRKERRQETVARQLKGRAEEGKTIASKTAQLIEEQQQLSVGIAGGAKAIEKLKATEQEATRKADKIDGALERYKDEREVLESRRRVFRHDVELDSLFSVMKVGLTLLVTYVLKEYLGRARMDVATFLERVATLPARVRYTPELEIVTFEYNHRDPDVMAFLSEHIEGMNAKKLRMKSGRILRLAVDPAPAPRRPPPPNRRTNPGDRFRNN